VAKEANKPFSILNVHQLVEKTFLKEKPNGISRNYSIA
jgi:hypothetical protein